MDWFSRLAPWLQGFLGALLAGIVILLSLRLYNDDKNINAIVAMINQNQRQQQTPPAPAVPPGPKPVTP